jgi:hypothetical protein
MKTFFKRMVAAGEADRTATPGAILVVLIASAAAAFGLGATSFAELAGITIGAFLSWMAWIALTLVIGRRMMPEPQSHTNAVEILRTTGFSASPGVLRIFAAIPGLGFPVFLGISLWMSLTFVLAIRAALDYSTFTRAASLCVLSWIVHGLLFFAFVRIVI